MSAVRDVEALARGLVASWLIDQVSARGQLVQYAAAVAGVIGVLLGGLADGWWRALGVVLVVVAVAVVGSILLVRAIVIRLILRFATPRRVSVHRDRIAAALDEADLPTSAVGIARFLIRLRRGVGTEVKRLREIVGQLTAEISDDET